MRAFIAIPVPDDVKQNARMLRNKLGMARPDIKWVEYQNYHLTVKFLGEVENNDLSELKRNLRLAADAVPAFNLSAGGIGFFPNQVHPRVIWMGIKGEIEKAEFLGDRVDAYLAATGFEPERDHRPHLTLGRIRSDKNLNEMLNILEKYTDKNKLHSFRVEKFCLMQSILETNGPQYTVLDTYRLNG